MNIVVKSSANIKDVLGSHELAIELPAQSSLFELLAQLTRRFGTAFDRQIRDQFTGEIVPFLLLINGKTVRSTVDLPTLLHDGDTVTIMLPFDGG
jgi:molybdopterin converting factor small subunit